MSDGHYADDELLAYIDENDAVIDLAAVRAHVLKCDTCTATVDDLIRWSRLLAHPAVWAAAPVSNAHAPDALANLAARAASDDAASEAFVRSLAPLPVGAWRAAVVARPDVQTPGLARRLITEARTRLNSAPADALTLSDLALSVASGVAPADVRIEADAWKQRANALRLLGSYHEALGALDEAERRYRQYPAAAYDLAFVDWGRATVFLMMKRFSDAKRFVRRAVSAFRDHEDEARLAQVRILEGSILFDEGDIGGAAEVFHDVLPLVREIGDEESLARVLANLSGCEARLGFYAECDEHAAAAAVLYDSLNMGAELVRLYWSLGDALKLSGSTPEALRALRTAASRFEALEMAGDVAAVGLDTLELLIASGETSEAVALCSRLLRYFREQGVESDAAEALNYLHQALRQAVATPRLCAYVREYVSAHYAGDRPPFAPPDAVH